MMLVPDNEFGQATTTRPKVVHCVNGEQMTTLHSTEELHTRLVTLSAFRYYHFLLSSNAVQPLLISYVLL
jgi:hypothetical protein